MTNSIISLIKKIVLIVVAFLFLCSCRDGDEGSAAPAVTSTIIPYEKPIKTEANDVDNSPSATMPPFEEEEPMISTPYPLVTEEKVGAVERIRQIIESREQNLVDISEYGLSAAEFYDVFRSLTDGDCVDVVAPYRSFFPYTMRGECVLKFCLQYTLEGESLEKAQEQMEVATQYALANVSKEMNDLEKVLVLHDYIVDNLSYVSGEASSTVWGGLIEHKAMCEGYAGTLIYLLGKVGVQAKRVTGDNHAWATVCIDGEWYLIDATWDDTRKHGKHYFLVRSEKEFVNELVDKHCCGKTPSGEVLLCDTPYAAVSDKYSNWFVHEVKGNIVYFDGYWYYAEDNKIFRSMIDGSEKKCVYECDTEIKIIKIEDNYIVIENGKKEMQISLD